MRERQQETILMQFAFQEKELKDRIKFLGLQISAQKESYKLSLAQLENNYISNLKNQEIKVQQKGLSAEEQDRELSALEEELKAHYESDLQAEKVQHKQKIAKLEEEKSVAESALHEENKKLLAGQKKLLSEQESAYEGGV